MSYPGYPPNEFALWLSQQVQQGSLGHPQAPLNPIPQHPVPFGSQAFSYPVTPQAQISTGSFPTNVNSTYSTAPLTMPFPVGSLPPQFPQLPFLQAGSTAPAYGSLENIWRSTSQYNEPAQSGNRPNDYPVNTQQVLPIRAVQQNHAPPPHYENQSAATHLTTIHPSLGLCVLVPIGQLGASAPPSPDNWAVTNSAGHRHRDHYSSRVDRLRRRHSRELTPYVRYMTPSPQRSPSVSPYLSSPSSTATVTPVMHYRHYNTPEFGRSPRRFHGIGGFTPLRRPQSVASVPRPSIEASPSTIGTCSQCGGTGGASPYEPYTDGSVTPTPRVVPVDAVMGQGESSREHGEPREESAEEHRRFQASMEEVDE